jgi:predicted acyl esterase
VYRLTAPAPGSTQELVFELWPTSWQLGPGDQLKLELTSDDSPTWRPDNLPATMTLTHLSLTVPTHS